jgi:hypothetical protein
MATEGAATADGPDPGLVDSAGHGPGIAGDPLAAFLNALASRDGGDMSATAAAGPPAILLSNGLNADAGVAQLISALASLHDGNAAFNATPFAAPSDPGLHGVIAPAATAM